MPTPPNILLITSDQQHWQTLGVNNPRIRTPHLDRLAQEGVYFERAYCSNPVCSPSRSSIITGLYPSWHHCWTIGVKLPEDVPTVGAELSRAGYFTALVGKAHFQPLASAPGSESLECHPTLRDLDFWRKFHGPWYGFEHVEVARNHGDEHLSGQHYGVWLEEQGLKNWKDYFMPWPHDPAKPRRRHSWDLPERYHYNVWNADRAIANLERSVAEKRPFFLWASFMDPHPPYLVPEPWASMYRPQDMQPGRLLPGELDLMPRHFRLTQEQTPDFSEWKETAHANHGFSSHLISDESLRKNMAIYYGMVSFMDAHIGRILTALERLGIADNTLVLFTTDHGHYLGQHGLTAKGAFHYEDLIRIPMLARWPGRIAPGSRISALQSQVDFAPTFLAAAGLSVPGLMQGVDQGPVWTGARPSARQNVIVENRHQPTAVHLRTYVDERYKMTVYRDQPYGEFFDLREDPEERRNLWDDPAKAALKCEVLHRFVNAEIQREPTRMPRIAGA